MPFENTIEFANSQDKNDVLAKYREQYYIPKINGKESVYFTGNSLGLQPKTARKSLDIELNDWAKFGVEGHFEATNPWYAYHEWFAKPISKIVGALPQEVVVMNGLTQNLHLLMVSFYQPEGKRTKILCEGKAFPSDQYALESQVKYHGLNPDDTIVELFPREGEHTVRNEDVLAKIKELGNSLALVMMGGVNYYTGQVFDMKSITESGHKVGAKVGFDLAHAFGNLKLALHDWDVDFAAWCSYKYLNSGPGGVAGVYINKKHCENPNLKRFAGWWGHDKETRFLMEKGFQPIASAEGWQMSNAPVVAMAVHKAAVTLFDEVGMEALCEKRDKLTAYLEFIINTISEKSITTNFEIITPSDKNQRGCQLSILVHGQGKKIFDKLITGGIVADWREPNVIRIAPVPMYNSFKDVYRFGVALKKSIA